MILDEEEVKAKQVEEEKKKMSMSLQGDVLSDEKGTSRKPTTCDLHNIFYKTKSIVMYITNKFIFFLIKDEEYIRPKSGKSARSMRNARRLSSIKSSGTVLDKDYYE